jgi:actin-related protein
VPKLVWVSSEIGNIKEPLKFNLEEIGFHPAFSQSVEQNKVDWLCKVFQKEGCRRLDTQNHVTAIISQQHLCAALYAARKSFDELLASEPNQAPHLRFSAGQVLCLHGRHRI